MFAVYPSGKLLLFLCRLSTVIIPIRLCEWCNAMKVQTHYNLVCLLYILYQHIAPKSAPCNTCLFHVLCSIDYHR